VAVRSPVVVWRRAWSFVLLLEEWAGRRAASRGRGAVVLPLDRDEIHRLGCWELRVVVAGGGGEWCCTLDIERADGGGGWRWGRRRGYG